MKKLGLVIALVVIILVVFMVGKNAFTKALLTQGLSKATHVPVGMGSVNLGLKNAKIEVRDLRVKNPRGYPEKLLLYAPEIAIDFDLKAFWEGGTHFEEVRLDLAELVVIRNKDGKLNVDELRPKQTKPKDSTNGKGPKFLIDKLVLSVGKVTYKDYSLGSEPIVQEFNIGIRGREYRGIDDPQSLVSLIMFETLTRTTLSNLANLDLGAFQNDASGILSKGLNVLGSNGEKVQKVAEEIFGIFK